MQQPIQENLSQRHPNVQATYATVSHLPGPVRFSSSSILYCTVLTINILMGKIIKFPATTDFISNFFMSAKLLSCLSHYECT